MDLTASGCFLPLSEHLPLRAARGQRDTFTARQQIVEVLRPVTTLRLNVLVSVRF